jgi:putative FmdB family regulatory protein
MPIYEYRCELCGAEIEVLQKISDTPIKDCPDCGKPAMKKLISAAGFQLKGSGWYATDFKAGPKSKDTPKKDDAKTNGEAKPGAACGSGACPACQ